MYVSLPYIEFFYGSLLYLFRIRVSFWATIVEIVQIACTRFFVIFLFCVLAPSTLSTRARVRRNGTFSTLRRNSTE